VGTNRARQVWSLNGWVVGNVITNQVAVLACKSKNGAVGARFRPGLRKSVWKGCSALWGGYMAINEVVGWVQGRRQEQLWPRKSKNRVARAQFQ